MTDILLREYNVQSLKQLDSELIGKRIDCLNCFKGRLGDDSPSPPPPESHPLEPINAPDPPPGGNDGPPADGNFDQYVLGLWKSVEKPGDNYVDIGSPKFWTPTMTKNEIYSTGECYGCTVVVAASGKGIYMAHYAEDTGSVMTFDGTKSFQTDVKDPFDNAIDQYRDSFAGQRSNLVIFSPTVGSSPNFPLMYPRVNQLATDFEHAFRDANVQNKGYGMKSPANNLYGATASGLIVVEWIAPKTEGDLAELNIYAESNRVVHVNYNAQGVLQH